MINFQGAALKRTAEGLARAAGVAGVNETAAFDAVTIVEADGAGFDAQGRPKILFEPEVFYRLLDAKSDKGPLIRAERAKLAAPKWGQIPYGKTSEQYPRLQAAMQIDESCALMGASWGAPQILGENFRQAGFASVQDMVSAFVQSEDAQLLGLAAFIKSEKLAAFLNKRAWPSFAAGYNGKAWRKNNYAQKLAQAYAHALDAHLPPPAPYTAEESTRAIAAASKVVSDSHQQAAKVAVATAAIVPLTQSQWHFLPDLPWWAWAAAIGAALIGGLMLWNNALGRQQDAAAAKASLAKPPAPGAPAGVAMPTQHTASPSS